MGLSVFLIAINSSLRQRLDGDEELEAARLLDTQKETQIQWVALAQIKPLKLTYFNVSFRCLEGVLFLILFLIPIIDRCWGQSRSRLTRSAFQY